LLPPDKAKAAMAITTTAATAAIIIFLSIIFSPNFLEIKNYY
jgi:hypothetical protein